MKAPTLRRLLFATAFLTAVVSAALVPGEGAPPKRAGKSSAPAAAAPQAPRAAAREAEMPALLAYRRSMEEGIDVVDVFEARLPPGAAAPAPKPVPPKVPFTYVGLIEEAGRAKVVLAQGDQLHIVAKGEQFASSYRLEEIGTDQAVVTYIPLDARQTVTPGAVPGAPVMPGPPGTSRGPR
jgi:hypothetical protein